METILKKQITNSSQVQGVEYNPESKVLTVTYKDRNSEAGKKYNYFDVPVKIWDGLLAAESVGKYINANVKTVYNFKFIG